MSAGVSRCSEQTFTIFMPNWLKGHHSRTWGKVRVRSAIGLWVRCNSNLVWLFGWGQPYHLHIWNYLGWSFPLRSRDNSGSCQCWKGFGSSHIYAYIELVYIYIYYIYTTYIYMYTGSTHDCTWLYMILHAVLYHSIPPFWRKRCRPLWQSHAWYSWSTLFSLSQRKKCRAQRESKRCVKEI